MVIRKCIGNPNSTFFQSTVTPLMQELEMLCTMCIWHISKRNGIIGPYAYFSFLISVDVKKFYEHLLKPTKLSQRKTLKVKSINNNVR